MGLEDTAEPAQNLCQTFGSIMPCHWAGKVPFEPLSLHRSHRMDRPAGPRAATSKFSNKLLLSSYVHPLRTGRVLGQVCEAPPAGSGMRQPGGAGELGRREQGFREGQ